jgi:hypothetical protein
MNLDISKPTDEHTDWSIPLWLKISITAFVLVDLGFWVSVLLGNQQEYFAIPTDSIELLLFFLLVVLSPISVAFWFFSNGGFSLVCYWLMHWLREPLRVLSLLGILYLLIVRMSLSLLGISLYVLFLTFLFVAQHLRPVSFQDTSYPPVDRFFFLIRQFVAVIESIPSWILRTIVALLPVTIVCFVIYFVFGSRLSNYGPYGFWNDETGYWVWLRSFHYVGLTSGYNAPNEILAPWEWSRYGEASPLYIYIYGSITKLSGWFSAFPVVINFVLFTISIYGFLWISRFNNRQIVLTGLAIIFTWPVLLYLPITSHETLNQIIGVLLAAIFIRLFTDRETLGWPQRFFIILFVYVATLIRLSWGLMLIPILFYGLKGKFLHRAILSIVLGCALYGSAIVLIGYFLPPINNSIFATFQGGVGLIVEKVLNQLDPFLTFKQFTPNWVVLFEMLVVMGWSVAHFWRLLRSKGTLAEFAADPSAFDLYNMASLFVAGFTFYLSVAFYRTFAPAMLIVYLLLIMREKYDKLLSLLLINILSFSAYMFYLDGLGDARIIKSDYTTTIPSASEISAEIKKFIEYDPKASNPWCNTLLIPVEFYHSRLIFVPPGIGISSILEPDTYQLPIKSRYVWINKKSYTALKGKTNLANLTNVLDGTLYLNLDVQCQPVP